MKRILIDYPKIGVVSVAFMQRSEIDGNEITFKYPGLRCTASMLKLLAYDNSLRTS